jgi:hypothetical protein
MKYLLVLFILMICSTGVARDPDGMTGLTTWLPEHDTIPTDTTKNMSSMQRINAFMQWYMLYFPVPFGSYSKETNLLFGLSKYNAFTLGRGADRDSLTQASSISAFGYYTLNTQYKMVLESNMMLPRNKAIWKTDLIYVFYPLQYFGTGNDTDINNLNTLNTTNFQFYTFYLFRVWRKWYVGPVVDFTKYSTVDLIAGDDSSRPGVRVSEALGRQSGAGIKITREGRDNRLNARYGTYFDASLQFYNKAMGSNFNYNYFSLDFRHYYTFTNLKSITLASQIRTESKNGNVPIQSLALLGGDYFMRGTYLGRYRDKVVLDTQAELRFPLYWIFGGVIFGGLGQVAPNYGKIGLNRMHGSYGMGVRVQVDNVHRVNLRLDMGFSKDQSIFIMNFSEAF